MTLGYNPETIKKGDDFYHCIAYVDNNRATVSISHYIVRSIKAPRGSKTRYGVKIAGRYADTDKRVHLTEKNDVTWVKVSRKNFDYGWTSSIHNWYRKEFILGGQLPWGVRKTKLQTLNTERMRIKHCKRTSNADKVKILAAIDRKKAKVKS